MRLILFIFFLSMLCTVQSCDKNENTYVEPLKNIEACGKTDPLNQLEWLNAIANKALSDKTGNYMGSIWIVSYNDVDLVITDMSLGSGGIYFHIFDCSGSIVEDLDLVPPLENIENYLSDRNKIFFNL